MKERGKWSEKYLFKAKRKSSVILRRSRMRIINFTVLSSKFFLINKNGGTRYYLRLHNYYILNILKLTFINTSNIFKDSYSLNNCSLSFGRNCFKALNSLRFLLIFNP